VGVPIRSSTLPIPQSQFNPSRQSTIKIDTTVKPEKIIAADIPASVMFRGGHHSVDLSSLTSDRSNVFRDDKKLRSGITELMKSRDHSRSPSEVEEIVTSQDEDHPSGGKLSKVSSREPSSSGGEGVGRSRSTGANSPIFAQSSSDEEEGEEGEGDEEGFDSYFPDAMTPGILASSLQFSSSPPQASQMNPVTPVRGLTGAFTMSASLSDPRKIILSGYLMKQGKRKSWRKRWFILMSQGLAYAKSHMVSLYTLNMRFHPSKSRSHRTKFINIFPLPGFST
jgi:hypothetical protein